MVLLDYFREMEFGEMPENQQSSSIFVTLCMHEVFMLILTFVFSFLTIYGPYWWYCNCSL